MNSTLLRPFFLSLGVIYTSVFVCLWHAVEKTFFIEISFGSVHLRQATIHGICMIIACICNNNFSFENTSLEDNLFFRNLGVAHVLILLLKLLRS